MNVKCLNCNKSFSKINSAIKRFPNHYCSRSCSASANNRKNPRRTKTKKCQHCDNLILSNRKRCPDCISKHKLEDCTLSEAIYHEHHKSSAYAKVRSRARKIAKQQGWKSCCECGYDKHIEIAHIKPIASFDLSTKLSVINDPSNLKPLCPNCHWEFDH